MVNWTWRRPRRNKANFRAGSNGRRAARLPVPPVGPSVRNKANLPPVPANIKALVTRARKRSGGDAQPTRKRRMARGNSAKQSQFARTGRRRCRLAGAETLLSLGTIVRNKANLPAGTKMGAGRRSDQRGHGSSLLRQTNPICRRRAWKTIVKARGLGDATRQADARDLEQTIASGARQSAAVCRPHPWGTRGGVQMDATGDNG
jgi:hypothetical protein